MTNLLLNIRRDATLSPCRSYRYSLSRIWDEELPTVLFVALNPSTADETIDDPTVRRCVGFADAWGYGGLEIVNLFGLRATDPTELLAAADPVGPDNDAVVKAAHINAHRTIVAWGARGSLLEQDSLILEMLGEVYCLGKTKGGNPLHPLYLPKDTQPRIFRPSVS